MTPDLIEAATDLVGVLVLENAALQKLDLARAASFSDRKRDAAEKFAAALARAAQVVRAPATTDRISAAERFAAQLRDLAAENKRLLERAIIVQGRVIATLVRAIPKVSNSTSSYRANGAFATKPKMRPVALLSRA